MVKSKMTVAAYMVEREVAGQPNKYYPDWYGFPRDWEWVKRQWDRIANAGGQSALLLSIRPIEI